MCYRNVLSPASAQCRARVVTLSHSYASFLLFIYESHFYRLRAASSKKMSSEVTFKPESEVLLAFGAEASTMSDKVPQLV